MKDEEIALMKRQIETQLDELERDMAEALQWWREWKSRPRGFRAKRNGGMRPPGHQAA